MAQELPTSWDQSGWTTAGKLELSPRFSIAFNDTVPTGANTTASNGIWPIDPLDSDLLARFATLIRAEAPLSGVVSGCTGRCRAVIRAPALVPTCYSSEIPVDYTKVTLQWAQQSISIDAAPIKQQSFWIAVGLAVDQIETIRLATGYFIPKANGCSGIVNSTACTLRSAGEYFLGNRCDKDSRDLKIRCSWRVLDLSG
jgi:hypothetical protein